MNQSLGYLKEILSNYTDRSDLCKEIYAMIKRNDFISEESFVQELTSEQIDYLNKILPDEINHAREVNDSKRVEQLNEIFELLY
ncbi:sporulation protein [Bacillus sp. 7504-2]|nr:sporulation protein [Bacillus sp. 7504-2]